jgi:hypothetical protein
MLAKGPQAPAMRVNSKTPGRTRAPGRLEPVRGQAPRTALMVCFSEPMVARTADGS